jgi:hypothetical protein
MLKCGLKSCANHGDWEKCSPTTCEEVLNKLLPGRIPAPIGRDKQTVSLNGAHLREVEMGHCYGHHTVVTLDHYDAGIQTPVVCRLV